MFFYVLVYHGRSLFWMALFASFALSALGLGTAAIWSAAIALAVSFFNLGLTLGRANVPEA